MSSVGRNKYYVSFIDDYSKFTWIYLLRQKSDVFACFRDFQTLVERQFDRKIRTVQTDWGGEYQALSSFFTCMGIAHHVSCHHAHQQNGSAEWKHRHIVEVGLTLLAQASMPLKFWDEAFLNAVFLINRLPSKVINDETPFFRIYSKHPNYSSLGTFGCACWPNMRPYNSRKLEFRSKRCVFLGYNHKHKGYKCLDPSEGRVYTSRDVIFDEHIFPFASMHPNAGAQLKVELALLPDLFDSSSSCGGSFTPDQEADSSLPANPSSSCARDCTISSEILGESSAKLSQNTVLDGQHFMCPLAGDSAAAEGDLPAEPEAPDAVSPSGSGELLSPSTAAPVGHGSSMAGIPRSAPSTTHAAAQTDQGRESASSAGSIGSVVPPESPGYSTTASSAAPGVAPSNVSHQGPVTRLQPGISKPKTYTDGIVRWGMSVSHSPEEPTSVDQALRDKNWVAAMDAECQALEYNKTWHLVPRPKGKISLEANGSSSLRERQTVQLIGARHG
jgi:histone deacetylase 1/2